MQKLSYENEFDLHLNGLVTKTELHMKGFALGLVLKQRQRELGNGLLATFVLPVRSFFFWPHVSNIVNYEFDYTVE